VACSWRRRRRACRRLKKRGQNGTFIIHLKSSWVINTCLYQRRNLRLRHLQTWGWGIIPRKQEKDTAGIAFYHIRKKSENRI